MSALTSIADILSNVSMSARTGERNSWSAVPLVSEQSLDGPRYVFLGGLGLCRGRGIRRYVVIAGARRKRRPCHPR